MEVKLVERKLFKYISQMPQTNLTIFWMKADLGQYLSGLNAYGDDNYLSPREQKMLCAMRFSAHKPGWLLGRLTAKKLLRLVDPNLSKTPFTDITIDMLPNGAPLVVINSNDYKAGTISIAHFRNITLTAYCPEPVWGLGIDLEWIEEGHKSHRSDHLTIKECDIARQLPQDQKTLWLTTIMSIKNSILKAFGSGLDLDLRSIEVTLPVFGSLNRHTKTGWNSAQVRSNLFPDQNAAAWWRLYNHFVVSLAVFPPPSCSLSLDQVSLLELS